MLGSGYPSSKKAEETTSLVETTVREIRRGLRKKYSSQEKVHIQIDGLLGEATSAESQRGLSS